MDKTDFLKLPNHYFTTSVRSDGERGPGFTDTYEGGMDRISKIAKARVRVYEEWIDDCKAWPMLWQKFDAVFFKKRNGGVGMTTMVTGVNRKTDDKVCLFYYDSYTPGFSQKFIIINGGKKQLCRNGEAGLILRKLIDYVVPNP